MDQITKAPLFSGSQLQQIASTEHTEHRVGLLYGSLPLQPEVQTESSSIPHKDFQAEVARQLAGSKSELQPKGPGHRERKSC